MSLTDLLARTKLTSLSPEKLTPLIQASDSADGEALLLQSHYHVAGSLEEHLGAVRTAFRKWCREEANGDCRYSYILGVTATTVIFYSTNWSTDENCYYTISYTAGEPITFGSDLTAVEAKIVISALGLTPDATTTLNTQAMEPKIQDAVTATTVVSDTALGAGGGTSADSPDLSNVADTDALDAHAAVPAPIDGALGDGGGTNAGIAGTNNSPSGDTTLVAAAEAKVEDGTKQSAVTKPENLLQSSAVDMLRKIDVSCLTQTREADDGNGGKNLILQCVVTRADIINSQGQVYPKKVWEKQIQSMNELAQSGKFTGKVEHPEDFGLKTVSLRWLPEFQMQGSDVVGAAVVVETIPDGHNLRKQAEAGVQINFSTVGYGSSKPGNWLGQSVKMIQDDFVCTRIDAVKNDSSFGSTTIAMKYQSESTGDASSATPMEPLTQAQILDAKAETEVTALAQANTLSAARAEILTQAATKLNEQGMKAFTLLVSKATTAAELLQARTTGMDAYLPIFAKATEAEVLEQSAATVHAPQFYVAQSKEQLAPQTPMELINRMVADLPTHYPNAPQNQSRADNPLHSPRAMVKQIMVQTAKMNHGPFNGRAAIMSLLALEQGHVDAAENILEQSLATGAVTAGSTNADPGGAPVSTPYIFPLIRRVYPMYIMNQIASIQPMDRPDGKIFYLDNYRVVDGTNDANALPGSSTTTTHDPREDVNTSANPFSTSFADNNTEGSSAAFIRLSLASVSVRATNKKLGAQWSIEEMQDLRSYHNLDVAQELMSALAREMAIEWNGICLADMLAGATASARTYGTQAPAAGFTQDAWDNYFWTYLAASGNDIFKRRNGAATHIVMGPDAALAASKSMRATLDLNSADSSNMELYPGTQFFPMVTTPAGDRLRIIKTNFWTGANSSKILVLRKGEDWNDTPYAFCPYADYVTPQFTNPSDFSQTQGLMSRCARKVVVGDAMATLTVANQLGVPLF